MKEYWGIQLALWLVLGIGVMVPLVYLILYFLLGLVGYYRKGKVK